MLDKCSSAQVMWKTHRVRGEYRQNAERKKKGNSFERAEDSSVSQKKKRKSDESRFDLSIGRSLITTPGFYIGRPVFGNSPRVMCIKIQTNVKLFLCTRRNVRAPLFVRNIWFKKKKKNLRKRWRVLNPRTLEISRSALVCTCLYKLNREIKKKERKKLAPRD